MIEAKPLAGKKILITRAKSQSKRFASKIQTFGGIPIAVPLIAIQPPNDKQAIIETLKQIKTFDWLVFTSQNGVQAFFSVVQSERISFQSFQHLKMAVVGKSTDACLRQYGFKADVVPEGEFTAESLAKELLKNVQSNERVLFARGDLVRDVLMKTLRKHGIKIVDVVVYENKMNQEAQPQLLDEIKNNRIDAVAFTSPSTVDYFVAMLEDLDWQNSLINTCFAAIGPITERAMLRHGIEPDVIAQENTTDGLVSALVKYFEQLKQRRNS